METRNKIREQNRQDVKSAGPQSQLLASVITEKSRSPSAECQLSAKSDAETTEEREEVKSPEPEPPPNPFSQLTDQELEEYKKEVEMKKLGLNGPSEKDSTTLELPKSPEKTPDTTPVMSPLKTPPTSPTKSSGESVKTEAAKGPSDPVILLESSLPPVPEVNGKEEEDTVIEEEMSKRMSQMTTNTETEAETVKDKTESLSSPISPEGSPSKSPSKKKKKFRTPSFLKKSKKKEKTES